MHMTCDLEADEVQMECPDVVQMYPTMDDATFPPTSVPQMMVHYAWSAARGPFGPS